jgi:GTP cyclohydrolase I
MTLSKIPEKAEERQAAAVLEQLYAPLVKKLNLTAEQSQNFYQMILDTKMRGQAQVTELLRHEDPSRMARTLADFQKEMDARMQALLGTANFAEYKEYQTSVGDRGLLLLTKNDFASCPLSEEQEQHLLGAMESGRKTIGNSASGSVVGFSIADTSDVMREKLSRQESIDQYVLEQAAGFLSPVQLKILASALAKLMTARKVGYEKARATFGKHRSEQ